MPDPNGFGIYGAYSVTGSGRLVGGAHRLGHGAELGFVYDPNGGAVSVVRYPGAIGTVLFARTPSGILGAYYYQLHSTAQRYFVRFGTSDYTLTLPFAASFTISGSDSNLDFTGGYTDAGGTTHAFAAICPADQAPCTQ